MIESTAHRRAADRSSSALRTTASVLGMYAGLLGIEHGLFETLQGNTPIRGFRIMAVRGSGLPFPFGHEPAVTLVPNFMVTGILAIVAGFAIVLYSALFMRRRGAAGVLFLSGVALFLAGGGFGPMAPLIVACIAAFRIGRTNPRNEMLARLWPWPLLAALAWVPIEVVLGFLFHLENDRSQTLANRNFLFSYPLLFFLILTLLVALAHDGSASCEAELE